MTPNAENEECFIVVRAVKPNMIKQIPKHEGTQKMEHFFLVHSYSLSKKNLFSRKGDGGGENLTVVGGGLKSFAIVLQFRGLASPALPAARLVQVSQLHSLRQSPRPNAPRRLEPAPRAVDATNFREPIRNEWVL